MFVPLWICGVFLIVVGCLFASLGLVLMKSSSQKERHLPLRKRVRFFLGIVFLVITASAVDVVALAITPLSLVAPFSGLTIVFATLLVQFGVLSERERVDWRRWAYICLVLLGVSTVSAVGPRASVAITETSMLRLLANPAFTCFVVLNVPSIVAVLAFVACRAPAASPAAQLRATAFIAYSAAACGSLSQCSVKVIATTLESLLNDEEGDEPGQIHTFISLACLLTFAPLQLYLLNIALARSPVSYAVPLYESLHIILAVAAGATLFLEFMDLSSGRVAGFAIGVATTLLGLGLLNLEHRRAQEDQAAMWAGVDPLARQEDSLLPPLDASLAALAPQSAGRK